MAAIFLVTTLPFNQLFTSWNLTHNVLFFILPLPRMYKSVPCLAITETYMTSLLAWVKGPTLYLWSAGFGRGGGRGTLHIERRGQPLGGDCGIPDVDGEMSRAKGNPSLEILEYSTPRPKCKPQFWILNFVGANISRCHLGINSFSRQLGSLL